MPDASSSKFYRWFFGFGNWLAANITRGKVGLSGGQTPKV
jgi:hypothetical protein